MRVAMPLAGLLFLTATLSGCLGVDNMAELKAALGHGPQPLEVLPPIARLRASPTLAGVGQPVAFSAQGSADPQSLALSYLWTFGDGARAEGSEVSHRYAAPGTFTATLAARSMAGLLGTDTVLVTVVENRAPMVHIAIARGGEAIERAMAGEELTFTGTVRDPEGLPVTLGWDFGDGGTAIASEARHAYARGGLYTVTLRAEDPAGLVATATRTVAIDELVSDVGSVALTRERATHPLEVAAGVQRVAAQVEFPASLGLNALRVTVLDARGEEVGTIQTQPAPGTQGVVQAVLDLAAADVEGHAPGGWTLRVDRASGVDVAYEFTVEVRY